MFGMFGSRTNYARSLGINVDLAWGILLLTFRLAMMVPAKKKKKSGARLSFTA
jgi:hypothetical protein